MIDSPWKIFTPLQTQITVEAKNAAPAKKQSYETALAICKAIGQAITEREQSVASLKSNSSVHASTLAPPSVRRRDGSREYYNERVAMEQKAAQAAKNDSDVQLAIDRANAKWAPRSTQFRNYIMQNQQLLLQMELNAEASPGKTP